LGTFAGIIGRGYPKIHVYGGLIHPAVGSAKLPLDVLVAAGRAVNVAFVVFVQGAASIAIVRNKSMVATDTAFEEHMLGLTVPVHQAASIGGHLRYFNIKDNST